MTGEWQTDFLLRAQSLLLTAALKENPHEAYVQRKEISICLGQIFIELVTRLGVPLVIEIGAHEARFSEQLKHSLPHSRIVAFEAHPLVYQAHAERLAQLGIEYMPLCVGDSNGDTILRVPTTKEGGEKLGKGSLLRKVKASFAEYPVRMMRLDDFLGGAAATPNAMWIDVEGALAQVFSGADHALRSCQALLVEMETNALWEGQITDAEAISRLAAYGLQPVLRDIQHTLQYNAMFLRLNDAWCPNK